MVIGDGAFVLFLLPFRGVSTVTTTARWGASITPMWPYLPATGCSKWTSKLAVLWISLKTLASPLHSFSTLFLLLSLRLQRHVWWRSPRVPYWAPAPKSLSCKLFQLHTSECTLERNFLSLSAHSPTSYCWCFCTDSEGNPT